VKYILRTLVLFSCTLLFSCDGSEVDPIYKEHMRDFVRDISSYAKDIDPNFIIIPQNGHELATVSGDGDDNAPSVEYLASIDGAGQEDLLYGYDRDDKETVENTTEYLSTFLDICESHGVEVLVTDYCSTHENMDDSYQNNKRKEYISFAAPDRELSVIPEYPATIYNTNEADITKLSEAKNFLYLLNPEKFSSAEEFVTVIGATDYDLIIIDFFFEDEEFTANQIKSLKKKFNGAQRLLISYMSIGEAEDYRFYWDSDWDDEQPDWIEAENTRWPGNYKVKYWNPNWQSIIFGSNEAYLDKIIAAGFDGVYLDIIDAFDYFEYI
jgi:cysteinyl-tRNA synthetase, unknown class